MKKQMNRDGKKGRNFFIKTAAVAMALIMTVMPVAAAGESTGESQWSGKTYIHTVDVTEKVIKKGIDVSSHQGDIDWEKVKADESADVSFAFVRIGYPVYTDAQTVMTADFDLADYDPETCDTEALNQIAGSARAVQVANYYVDDKFEYNFKEALAAGIDSGIYFFSRAITPNEAAAEAQWVIAKLEELGYSSDDLGLPIVFDYEYEGNAGRVYNADLSSEKKTAICNAFCQVITDAGYQAGVYANRSMFTESQKIDTSKLNEGTKVWLAQYNTQSTFDGNYDFWQCTDTGTVDGISTSVDYDFGYFPVEEGEGYQIPSESLENVTTGVSNQAITLTWDAVEGADGYSVLRSSRWNGSLGLIGAVEKSQGTCTYTDNTVDADYEYYYRIYPYKISDDGTKIYADGTDIISAYVSTVEKQLRTTSSVRLRAHAGTGDIQVVYQLPEGAVLEWHADTMASNGVVWNKVTYTVSGKEYMGYVSSAYTTAYQEPIRIYGATRYETSLGIADELKAAMGIDKFDAVVVATGENFADALSGSYLAYKENAPILIINKDNKYVVKNYIRENLKEGGKIYVLGGTTAIPDNWISGLSGVERLGGATRYETNLKILEAAKVKTEDILICTGTDFADSLSASAAKKPILLVGGKLTDGQKSYLKSISSDKYFIIGGEQAVSPALEAEVGKYASDVERLGGKTRHETSILVADTFVSDPDAAILAYSYNFPDGLCGGPLAMAMNAPLILTKTGSEAAAESYADREEIYSGIVLGGSILISDDSVKRIFGAISIDTKAVKVDFSTERMSNAELYQVFFENTYGPDTYETYDKINKKLMERNEYQRKSSYYIPLSRYWENVRGVTDIGYRIEPLYYTDMKYYTAKDFANDPAAVIKIAKNEIYARHGYIFTNKDLYNYFMGCAWYEPAVKASEFDTSVLNKYEMHNLKILNQLE